MRVMVEDKNMLSEITSFCSGILASVFANELGELTHNKIDNKKKRQIEEKTLDNIEEKIKSQFEQEHVKDWLFKHQYEIEQAGCIFDERKKEKFIEEFFSQHAELKYIYSTDMKNVIKEYLDDINEWVNGILSIEGKLVVHTIKKEQILQGDRITEQIIESTKKIIEKIEEKQNGERIEKITKNINEKNTDELKQCQGFGIWRNKCRNFITRDGELCKECKKLEYYNRIENLYRIQNYFITKQDGCFCAEQKSGIIKSSALVFPLYAEKLENSSDDLYELIAKINEVNNIENYQWIHIVSNGEFDNKSRKLFSVYGAKVKIMSEQDIIDGIMDFSTYLQNTIDEYKLSALCNHYIDVYDENSEELLSYSIDDFLNVYDENAFLILGDYGCGKTSFLLHLAYRLSEDFLSGEGDYIPLFIPLKDYAKSINLDNLFLNLFINKCRMSNISIDAFKMLLNYKKFVILFDGFDEVAKRVNYDVKFEIFNEICKYCIGNTKIIVTCRPNYFQEKREYKNLIESAHLQFEPNTYNNAKFDETYIAELSAEQIEQYIETFKEELAEKRLNPSDLKQLIGNTHDLMDLSKRPFLLNIIVQTLPQLVEELQSQKKEAVKINAAFLYKRYTEIWLDRENSKGKTLIRKEDKLHFCIHLAYKLFEYDEPYLHFSEFPNEIKEYFKDLCKIDEIDYFSHDIQSCSFMNSDGEGNFKFIHKSFMEYFVACYISEGLKKLVRKNVSIGKVLAVRGITSEVALFINDILEEDIGLHKQVVTALKKNINYQNENIRQNIVTILSKMKYNMKEIIENNKSYVEEDFSHSVIESAVIENVDFSKATFYGAVIKDVVFVNCDLCDTYFQKATLVNVDFSGQNLEYADFSYCNLEKCDFSNSLLAQAQISQATISNSNFNNCDMSGIESEGAKYMNNYNIESAIGVPYDMM